MASTRSGAKQTLEVGGTQIAGIGTGFSGLTLTQSGSPVSQISAGLETMHDSGHRVNGGSFSVDVNDTTHGPLFMQTGTRKACEWNDGNDDYEFDAVLEVVWNLQARAQETFDVTLYIDGGIT